MTPTQRELHDRYIKIHRKFFPLPPAFPRAQPPQLAFVAPVPPLALPMPPSEPQRVIGFYETKARLEIIRRVVCESYGITTEELMSIRRPSDLIRPRHVYCYLATHLANVSGAMIARSLHRDHTTILHAVRRMRALVADDQKFGLHMQRLEDRIRLEFGETARKERVWYGRYVEHHRVPDYERCGWLWEANHNEYAAVMIWPCDCRFVEPKA